MERHKDKRKVCQGVGRPSRIFSFALLRSWSQKNVNREIICGALSHFVRHTHLNESMDSSWVASVFSFETFPVPSLSTALFQESEVPLSHAPSSHLFSSCGPGYVRVRSVFVETYPNSS